MPAENAEIQIPDIDSQLEGIRTDDRGHPAGCQITFQLTSFVRQQAATVWLDSVAQVRVSVGHRAAESFDLLSLYKDDGIYPAWNVSGLVAFGVPVTLTVIAITTGELSWFYTYGWFTGSALGGLIYYFMNRG